MPVIVDPGELRHQVTLQRRDANTDALGARVQTWSDVTTLRCKIQTTTGRELIAAQAVNAEVTHAVICRYRPEFADPIKAAALRLLYRGRALNISAVMDDDERRQWLTLACTEGLNNG